MFAYVDVGHGRIVEGRDKINERQRDRETEKKELRKIVDRKNIYERMQKNVWSKRECLKVEKRGLYSAILYRNSLFVKKKKEKKIKSTKKKNKNFF